MLWLSPDVKWLAAGTNKGKILFYNLTNESSTPHEIQLQRDEFYISKVFYD